MKVLDEVKMFVFLNELVLLHMKYCDLRKMYSYLERKLENDNQNN